jgi:trans-2,3-dihydro-3-hydroxyanthranilate isomerase
MAARLTTLDFTQVDVFTRRPLAGNPLAVFHSGAGLSSAQMQAIAREMNLSETTFVFHDVGQANARVRIFTPWEELPFAGHPTLGTAYVVSKRRRWPGLVWLRMKAGVIPVRVDRFATGVAYLEMRQKDPVFRAPLKNPRPLAKALGIGATELDARYPPRVVSTGLPFLIVPLRRAATLARLRPDYRLLRPLLAKLGAHFPYYLVTGETRIEARMFDSNFEDPATGSAAGCAAAYLVASRRCPPDARFVIHQGRFGRRPSVIFASAALRGERVEDVHIGGYVVEILKGTLQL